MRLSCRTGQDRFAHNRLLGCGAAGCSRSLRPGPRRRPVRRRTFGPWGRGRAATGAASGDEPPVPTMSRKTSNLSLGLCPDSWAPRAAHGPGCCLGGGTDRRGSRAAPRHDFRGLLPRQLARSSPETWPSTAPSACSTIMTSAPNASIWRTRSTELPRRSKRRRDTRLRGRPPPDPCRCCRWSARRRSARGQLSRGPGFADDLQSDPVFHSHQG